MTEPVTARLRRLQWKLGRRLYMAARGEPQSNLPDSSDERYVQGAVLAATAAQPVLTVLDVGANKGQWTGQFLGLAPAARRQPGRLVLHAFEPVPATREVFAARLAAVPGRDCVQLHPLALSDREGSARIAIWGETAGTNTLAFDDDSLRRAQDVLEIRTATLDGFLDSAGLDRVDLVKIDAEGHDLRVIEGARGALRAGRIGVVQFEYSHRWIFQRCYLRDLFLLAQDLPYRVCRIRGTRIELLDAWHPELERFFDANFALVHGDALGWFAVRHGRFDGGNTYA
jgi:FkbM family methyltransferase